ncbi:hypothetical protein H7E67_02950 [Clostridium gasigenes]|uniref:hypothetical protein n=1 Tax=Clostridium gasigenes TaxID=94869 RepID=UPI00162AC5FD|nr:hypothetical protein [Clostridium gasigenes]MBB6622381.1 hypothetical protein [Clostridium gasigenes]
MIIFLQRYPILAILIILSVISIVHGTMILVYTLLQSLLIKIMYKLPVRGIYNKIFNRIYPIMSPQINKESKMEIINRKIENILSFLISFFTLLNLINFSYTLLKCILIMIFYSFNVSKNIVEYLNLTMIITLFTYFPQKFGLWIYYNINKLLKKLSANKSNIVFEKSIEEIEKCILFLRPKLLVYFISMLFTILNSLEKISGSAIVTMEFWMQIKPIVIESVFTVIVIDRFVNQFRNPKK